MSLHKSGGDDYAQALDEERRCERPARFRIDESGLRKESAAAEEEDDRDQGFKPAVGMGYRLVRSTQC